MATANGTPDFTRLSGDLYRQWEKAMSGWWDQVLESPAFLGAVNENMAANADARGRYEKLVDETMEKMHLPTRQDVVRLAKVCTLLEDRLLAQEDLLLELKDKLGAMEREAIQARIEAAEARLELRETLAALQKTGVSTPAVAASAPAATPPAPSRKRGGA